MHLGIKIFLYVSLFVCSYLSSIEKQLCVDLIPKNHQRVSGGFLLHVADFLLFKSCMIRKYIPSGVKLKLKTPSKIPIGINS